MSLRAANLAPVCMLGMLMILSALLASCGGPAGGLTEPQATNQGEAAQSSGNVILYEIRYTDPGCDNPGDENDWIGGVKDFSLIEANGEYHLFHIGDPKNRWNIDVNEHDPYPGYGERNFGHAVSQDLRSWSTLSRIELRDTSPDGWSRSHVWAPHVFEMDGLYCMFYTGVYWDENGGSGYNRQQTGLATSTDLSSWTRYDDGDPNTGPGFLLAGPDPALNDWCRWGRDLPWGDDCRDPYVFDDGDKYVMFLTVRMLDWKPVVATATNPSRDLVTWQWDTEVPPTEYPGYPGYIEVTATTQGAAESPNLLKHNGKYYLFWTSENEFDNIKVVRSETSIYGPYEPLTQDDYQDLYGYANEQLELSDGRTVYGAIRGDYELFLRRLYVNEITTPSIQTLYFKDYDPGVEIGISGP